MKSHKKLNITAMSVTMTALLSLGSSTFGDAPAAPANPANASPFAFTAVAANSDGIHDLANQMADGAHHDTDELNDLIHQTADGLKNGKIDSNTSNILCQSYLSDVAEAQTFILTAQQLAATPGLKADQVADINKKIAETQQKLAAAQVSAQAIWGANATVVTTQKFDGVKDAINHWADDIKHDADQTKDLVQHTGEDFIHGKITAAAVTIVCQAYQAKLADAQTDLNALKMLEVVLKQTAGTDPHAIDDANHAIQDAEKKVAEGIQSFQQSQQVATLLWPSVSPIF